MDTAKMNGDELRDLVSLTRPPKDDSPVEPVALACGSGPLRALDVQEKTSTRASRQPTRACRPRFQREQIEVRAILDSEVILLTQRKQG